MKRFWTAVVVAMLCAGCSTAPKVPIPVAPLAKSGAGLLAPWKGEAMSMFWPLLIATLIVLLAGAAVAYWQKNLRLLWVGLGMACIPPLFFLLAPMLAWPILIAVCTLLVLGLVFAGYWVWDYIKDDIEADKERKADHDRQVTTCPQLS